MLSLAGQGGDGRRPRPVSFVAVYQAFGPPRGRLVRLLMRMGCEREESCDIAQDALARLAERIDAVPNPEAWATRTAVNLYLSRCRHLRMRARRLPALVARGSAPDPAATVTDRMAVAMSVGGLDPVQRAIIVLRYFEDYRVREIAELLGKPECTVKYLIAQAEAALRRVLEEGQ
ncbi:MAG: RNA polymerase sigma factor [Acidimicrobiales bacterium]